MVDHSFNIAYSYFWRAIIKTSKIHNLLIQYQNNTYFNALESFENGDKIRKKVVVLMIVNGVSS
jgi:hypothetical protein